MTIKINYTNGTSVTYTNCTQPTLVDGVYKFTYTNEAGTVITVMVNWVNVSSVEESA